jgi:Tfp pilus assembly protein PilO
MADLNGFRSIDINLYQQRSNEFRGPSRQVLIIGSAFLFVLFMTWGFMLQSDLEDLDQKILQGDQEVSALQGQLQQMNANGRLDVWKDLPAAVERANRAPLVLLTEFSKHLPSDASVNSWVMDGTNTIRCDIDFGSTESLIRFRSTISKDEQFKLVSMESFVNQAVNDGEEGEYIPITTVNFVFEIPGVAQAPVEGGAVQ